jgi:hypothetical protein
MESKSVVNESIVNESIVNESVVNEQNINQPVIPEKKEIKLVDAEITDENIALNVLVSFVNLAQRRGVFTIDESAKIWECVKKFQRKD